MYAKLIWGIDKSKTLKHKGADTFATFTLALYYYILR